jgi:hypothetical protein
MKRPALLVLALVVSGCSGYGLTRPDVPPIDGRGFPPPGLAQVCVVRPHWLAAAVTLPVRDNGALVGVTRGPSYFCYFAEPGGHLIVSEDAEAGDLVGAQSVSALLVAGGRYYLHQKVHPFGHAIEWVDPDRGFRMLDRTGYRLVARVPAGENLPPAAPIAPAAPAPQAQR